MSGNFVSYTADFPVLANIEHPVWVRTYAHKEAYRPTHHVFGHHLELAF